MALPTTTHLTITGVGIASAGGLAYGGYFVFKDNPRPVTELLQKQKKTFLDKNADNDSWNANWKKYVDDNSTTKVTEEPASQVPPPPATPPSTKAGQTPRTTRRTVKTINKKDIWGLDGWNPQEVKDNIILSSFKDKCEEFKARNVSGTWDSEYQNIEKYCTKAVQSEDGEDT
ncbi:hypothetical protein A6V39_05015 [Candidatus Mycoplasma haematobovis]|uniref:Uncharacterized protein n=1 Tax=Candidatus Mycoplasma haematobovis TaxID=432608 RepID=A0A1A9QC16_9MOLU|nr:hypothetical protein [Candidatus Mycoplasma haematobovis]OAL09788.1 hypothetical protein A6V39_05015 [Candidatus Mycoplasma haematobovis]